jgi:hypothetical protein
MAPSMSEQSEAIAQRLAPSGKSHCRDLSERVPCLQPVKFSTRAL